MVEFITNLIKNEYLATLIMSFVPMIELKGAIVYARGVGMGFFEALGLSYLGSTLVFFPIFFLLIPILNLLKKIKFINRFAVKIETYFKSKADGAVKEENITAENKKSVFYKMLGVFIFVAIPLPLTGVWTGTAIAVFLGLKFKDAVLPVVIGNFVAGTLISLLALVCIAIWDIGVLDYILTGLLILALILLVITIIKVSVSKKPIKANEEEKE